MQAADDLGAHLQRLLESQQPPILQGLRPADSVDLLAASPIDGAFTQRGRWRKQTSCFTQNLTEHKNAHSSPQVTSLALGLGTASRLRLPRCVGGWGGGSIPEHKKGFFTQPVCLRLSRISSQENRFSDRFGSNFRARVAEELRQRIGPLFPLKAASWALDSTTLGGQWHDATRHTL